jgi:hypothetical protein
MAMKLYMPRSVNIPNILSLFRNSCRRLQLRSVVHCRAEAPRS